MEADAEAAASADAAAKGAAALAAEAAVAEEVDAQTAGELTLHASYLVFSLTALQMSVHEVAASESWLLCLPFLHCAV